MKINKLLTGLITVAGLSLAGITQSCVSDQPFFDGEGEGTLRMQLVVNSDVTRAQVSSQELSDSCVIYISGANGLLYSYKGIDNLPESLKLRSGNYVAEAWTGDSVTASFDKKFYRGYKRFDITQDNNTSVVLTCKIANVVVSIDHNSVDSELMKDWKITVSNSRGQLVFDASNMEDAKGYFMMPNADIAKDSEGNYIKEDGDEEWFCYTNLNYKIEGTTAAGKRFEKSGAISPQGSEGNIVKHAHEYRLHLSYNPEYEENGGSFVTIVVSDDEVLIEDVIGIYSKPSIKGASFDIERQLQGSYQSFNEEIVKVSAFNSIKQLILKSDDYEVFGLNDNYGVDLINAAPSVLEALRQRGLLWEEKVDESRNLTTAYLRFTSDYLNRLPEKSDEYTLNIYVKDGNGRENSVDIHIAVGEAAKKEEDPVVVDAIDTNNLLAVRATKATVSGQILNDEVSNPVIVYRVANGSDSWKEVPVNVTRGGQSFSVVLTDLTPSTTYEYAAKAGDFISQSYQFTTESVFAIPNSSFEDWSTYRFKALLSTKDVVFAGTGSEATFWDSGNAGSSAVNITLTDKSTDMHGKGMYSARLESKNASGMLAAGNLFVGKFESMSGLTGAALTFGRPFTGGSHPDALKLLANYRPASVTKAGQELKAGDLDHGQIYIAITSGPVAIDTNKSIFFNPDSELILGYGEKTWKGESFGPDNQLQELVIPIEWKERAKTTPATHIVIVCSASKFGDYFVGAPGSVLYLDDLELVY